jgi:CofD-related protein of GAK system
MSTKITITRTVKLPDRVRLARFARAPELGPDVLFFSGGTALNPVSRTLIQYTHNSTHLITPFDSGGSSAKIRAAFKMLAVGDVRNRLMALADQSIKGNPEIRKLFAYRFPKDETHQQLHQRLADMVRGEHLLVADIFDPMRKIIRSHLSWFQRAMPDDFDLTGASVGNMVLTGGFLNNARHIDPVIYIFTKLAEVRGVVRPVINADLHLVSELADGRTIVGQHLITGREVDVLESPIQNLYLSDTASPPRRVRPLIRPKIKRLIKKAELICYPMGSFYSSVVANLLPAGVVDAVAENDCTKIYIPNTGRDKEYLGDSLTGMVETLIHYLKAGGDRDYPLDRLLDFVLVDAQNGVYPGPVDVQALEALGVRVIDADLVSTDHRPYLDPDKICAALLSLV